MPERKRFFSIDLFPYHYYHYHHHQLHKSQKKPNKIHQLIKLSGYYCWHADKAMVANDFDVFYILKILQMAVTKTDLHLVQPPLWWLAERWLSRGWGRDWFVHAFEGFNLLILDQDVRKEDFFSFGCHLVRFIDKFLGICVWLVIKYLLLTSDNNITSCPVVVLHGCSPMTIQNNN